MTLSHMNKSELFQKLWKILTIYLPTSQIFMNRDCSWEKKKRLKYKREKLKMDIWAKLYKPRSKPILKKSVLSDCEGRQTDRQFICRSFQSIQQPSKHSSWWRRLDDILKTSFVFVFRRRLQDVFKTSWSRSI